MATKLFLVYMRHPYKRVALQPGCVKTAWAYKKVGPYVVGAKNPVQAAEFFINRLYETTPARLKRAAACEGCVCEYEWDGSPGFKCAANSDGDIRYDVRRGQDGYYPVHSEKSYA